MAERHQFRADWHDYNGGIYFVTICCDEKKHHFGEIRNGRMAYTPLGELIEECIKAIPPHQKDVQVLNHVVMPNHIHMVLTVGAQYIAPAPSTPSAGSPAPDPAPIKKSPVNMGCLKPPRHGEPCSDYHFNSSLAVVVRTFKAACTRLAKSRMDTGSGTAQGTARAQYIAPLPAIWQRNFHEHIIRTQRAFDNIMHYIDTNVENWCYDSFHPSPKPNAPWQ